MEYWEQHLDRKREELLRITSSREFYEVLEELVKRELNREGRKGLSVEGELARAVAVAIRTSVELILPLTQDDEPRQAGLPPDIMSAPPPFRDFPEAMGWE